ncbi:uncharacterized protein [Elaeis guineensis]|uniref:uncharacterized protein n=1 Tax=Elaeis guineensis var. tenera TaxID=51953 RepID=UPI003C6D90CE
MDCVEALSYAILINGFPMEFFYSMDGLHQGCPLSPYLFILYADALSRAPRVAVQEAELEPYWPTLGMQSLSHLLFAEDFLLIGQASMQNVRCFASIVKAYCWRTPLFHALALEIWSSNYGTSFGVPDMAVVGFTYCLRRILGFLALLSHWPTYINTEVDDGLWVCELITVDGRGWRASDISRLFNGQLADKILAMSILLHQSHDLRV